MTNIGLFVSGSLSGARHPVRHAELFEAAVTEQLVELKTLGEAYLSHYVFGGDLLSYLRDHRGSVAGYVGECTCKWLFWDIDRADDLESARRDSQKLAEFLRQRYGSDPLVFFSGSKGFHIALDLAFTPSPSVDFPGLARKFAKALAELAGIVVDEAIYDRLRTLRLPNSKHRSTGLYKIPLCLDELAGSVDSILELARQPRGRPLPTWTGDTGALEMDWQVLAAVHRAGLREADLEQTTQSEGEAQDRAPKFLLDFLRFGVPEGERAVTLFRCAAWLAEAGASPHLAHALLTEPALDIGLPLAEVKRQIDCGFEHVRRKQGGKRRKIPGIDDSKVIEL